jgi:hypothetical protein
VWSCGENGDEEEAMYIAVAGNEPESESEVGTGMK